MSGKVRITDLEEPVFSAEADELRGLMASMVESCPLDADALHAQATAEVGLSDFGASDYRERLDVYLSALREVGGLHAQGQVLLYMQLIQLLKNRLLLTELLRTDPQILEIELVPPVIIAGLPRTGTTHLQNTLAHAGTFRTLPYFESREPFPLPGERGVEPDPRIERCDQSTWFADLTMPYFPAMHEMSGDHVHEEIQLLANDFSTMLMETLADVPAWRDYYTSHDQTPHYRHLRLQLQALQHLGGGRRWLLKSPQHLEQLPALDAAFPDATLVFTHREPAQVVISLAYMIAYTARMHRNPVPVSYLANGWADRVDEMLAAFVRDRDLIGSDRSIDIRFDDYMADQEGILRTVYDLAGETWTAEVEANLRAYNETNKRHRHGEIDYVAADVGLDLDDLRGRYADYRSRFLG